MTKEIKQVNVTCNIHNFILRYETKASRRKPEKQHIVYQHIVYQHHLSEDDEKLTHKEFKIHLIDNNERFTAPARNLSVTELHSEISFCLELVSDAEKSCKEMIKMSPAVSQIHGVFLLAHESLRTALDLGKSADVAIGTANMALKDVGSVVLSLLECNLNGLRITINPVQLLVKIKMLFFLQGWLLPMNHRTKEG